MPPEQEDTMPNVNSTKGTGRYKLYNDGFMNNQIKLQIHKYATLYVNNVLRL